MTGSLNWTAIPTTKLVWVDSQVHSVGSGVRWDVVSPSQVSTFPYSNLQPQKRKNKGYKNMPAAATSRQASPRTRPPNAPTQPKQAHVKTAATKMERERFFFCFLFKTKGKCERTKIGRRHPKKKKMRAQVNKKKVHAHQCGPFYRHYLGKQGVLSRICFLLPATPPKPFLFWYGGCNSFHAAAGYYAKRKETSTCAVWRRRRLQQQRQKRDRDAYSF